MISVIRMENGYAQRDHAAARAALEKAYASSATAEEFLLEILRIFSEHGLLAGEMVCRLDGKEAREAV
jgi:hypothetical protein